jgi:hypothetical protein
MKFDIKKMIIAQVIILSVALSCSKESNIDPNDGFSNKLESAGIQDISIFADIMKTAGKGLLNENESKTIFIPTDEAFKHLDIAEKREYDKATLIAFLASQMVDLPLASANFKSGKITTSNTKTIRMYDGREFTQIEDALVEKADLKVGNLTVHLVDRIFDSIVLTGHDHNEHASGHSHGGTHDHSMTSNCGASGPPQSSIQEAISFRTKTSKFLMTLPTWKPTETSPRSLPGGFALMGGRNNGLPYIHYFSKTNMEDNKFMDPNAPEGLMCGMAADGTVYPISAVYLTREASAIQLHNLNCMFMFHEHDGLPGIMMHYFHDAYPSTNYGLDHEADPVLVRQMKMK